MFEPYQPPPISVYDVYPQGWTTPAGYREVAFRLVNVHEDCIDDVDGSVYHLGAGDEIPAGPRLILEPIRLAQYVIQVEEFVSGPALRPGDTWLMQIAGRGCIASVMEVK